jgi:hypothetical protein
MSSSSIGIILALLGTAATLYQLNRMPDAATESLAGAYWWMATWPM